MKKIRCPKCQQPLAFDDAVLQSGQSIRITCRHCGNAIGIRPPAPIRTPQQKTEEIGSITVIENVFHYQQSFPLHMGDNIIGRYAKSDKVDCPIKTDDPSIDMHHCVIRVSRNKKGKLQYVLRDGPSYTGTFVHNEILGDRETRIIEDGTLFSIGATSVILKLPPQEA